MIRAGTTCTVYTFSCTVQFGLPSVESTQNVLCYIYSLARSELVQGCRSSLCPTGPSSKLALYVVGLPSELAQYVLGPSSELAQYVVGPSSEPAQYVLGKYFHELFCISQTTLRNAKENLSLTPASYFWYQAHSAPYLSRKGKNIMFSLFYKQIVFSK